MGTDPLSEAGYWEDDAVDLRFPPTCLEIPGFVSGVDAAVQSDPRLRSHVVFSTSGSSGDPKFACLSREALLAGAEAANRQLEVARGDRWFRCLPTFHVGGFAIHARAYLAECGVEVFSGRWSAADFCGAVTDCQATLTSLVPTQLHDLVIGGYRSPDSLRGVLVGGAALDLPLAERALEFGWPILPTFGMTETASQLATARPFDDPLHALQEGLPLLPRWEVAIDEGRVLRVSGDGLFSGYLQRSEGSTGEESEWEFVDPMEDGWFRTTDRAVLQSGRLKPLGRVGNVVKILGEKVDLGELRRELAGLASSEANAVHLVAEADERAGLALVLLVEQSLGVERGGSLLAELNALAPVYAQVSLRMVEEIPRSAIGKAMG